MHMEALDRSFSLGSDGVMTLSSYPPLTPEPPLSQYSDCLQPQTQTQYSDSLQPQTQTQYSDCLQPQTQTQYSDCLQPQTQTQYSDCLQPQYSPIHYDDNYEHRRYDNLTSSPLSTPTPLDTPLHSSSYRTPLSSMSSYSSDSSCPLSTSQSSGLSEMPSISDMSISSDPCSSTLSLFMDQQSTASYNPFSVNHTKSAVRRGRKSACASVTSSLRSQDFGDSDVPRRSSAPARGVTTSSSLCPTSNNNTSQVTTRKDSFVYDVQLESDNVLLFVPDLDLVKSHLMFAVREEVDVLKERIGELMERINHLEYENTVLRKYATQEALQQIQQQHGGAPNP